MKTQLLTAALAVAAALAAPLSAQAHASFETPEVAAGKTAKIVLRVPHGCDGQATLTVAIALPEGLYAAKPMPKADWTLATETGAYATPYDNHGKVMTEGVRKITWTGELPDAWYDEFAFRAAVGPELAPGTELVVPVTQTCANGQVAWTEVAVPGQPEPRYPAPGLTVTAAPAEAGHDHAAMALAAPAAPAAHDHAAPGHDHGAAPAKP